MALLEIKNFEYYYGNIRAVKGINLEVNEGEIVTIIGSNGAGKSTTLKAISGLVDSNGIRGEICLDGQKISGLPGHKITGLGIAHVLEGRHVFSQLSVYENLMMGAFCRNDQKAVEKDIEMIFRRFPRLEERKNQSGGTLSGGEQQMLAIGRALVSKPRILLMDEPSLGLAPIIVKEIFETIRQINREDGTTILLVEQNSKMALNTARRGYVMQVGEIVLTGSSDSLLNDERVQKAYLGMQ